MRISINANRCEPSPMRKFHPLAVEAKKKGKTMNLTVGIVLAALVSLMLLGGARRIGVIAERLVPFASAAYLLLGCGVLIVCRQRIPDAFSLIFEGAFSPRAMTGGLVGSGMIALRTGVSRGVFTNEAGMGTASIAHASAKVAHPVEQGMMGAWRCLWIRS